MQTLINFGLQISIEENMQMIYSDIFIITKACFSIINCRKTVISTNKLQTVHTYNFPSSKPQLEIKLMFIWGTKYIK